MVKRVMKRTVPEVVDLVSGREKRRLGAVTWGVRKSGHTGHTNSSSIRRIDMQRSRQARFRGDDNDDDREVCACDSATDNQERQGGRTRG